MARRCTKEGCTIHSKQPNEQQAEYTCNCDHYRGYVCCEHQTRELARILLKGNTVEFDLDEGYIRYMLRHGRKADLDAAFWAMGKMITDIEADYIYSQTGYRASDEQDI